MENEVVKPESFFAVVRELFTRQDRQGKQDKEDIVVAREFEKVNKELEIREQTVRVGEIIAKVRGKGSINQKITFSKEKSQGVKRAEVGKGPVLGERSHEKQIRDENDKIQEI